jgi:hypothetical protein
MRDDICSNKLQGNKESVAANAKASFTEVKSQREVYNVLKIGLRMTCKEIAEVLDNLPRQPNGIAFDGSSLWIATVATNTVDLQGCVFKVRFSDGAQIFFFRGDVNEPSGIAFDGTSVWVANFGDLTVSQF